MIAATGAITTLLATFLEMPTSTTHVSCGAIFGIGVVSRSARWKTAMRIVITWLTTPPLGAALGAFRYWVLSLHLEQYA